MRQLIKNTQRKYSKAILENLDLETISIAVNKIIRGWQAFNEAKSSLFYLPMSDEISLLSSLNLALSKNKACFVPRFVLGIEENFEPLYSNYSQQNEIYSDFSFLDLIFVPGLMFDEYGFRLGRGKGFFDRVLSEIPDRIITVGVIPEALLKESLSDLNILDEWDQRVKYLLTEKRLLLRRS